MAATRASIETTLREVLSRFDAERKAGRSSFSVELEEISARELERARERLQREGAEATRSADAQEAGRVEAIRSALEERIEMRLAERGSAIDGRLKGVEQTLTERIERSLRTIGERAERLARERAESVGQSTSAALGEQISTLIEREMKSALERQSAALAAASLHHQRALEKSATDRSQAIAAELEQNLATSLDRRLGEIQAVVDSQVRQRAEGFEESLAEELRRTKDELSSVNSEGMLRLGAQLSEITETKQTELTERFEQALETHRAQLGAASEKHLLERTEALTSEAHGQLGEIEGRFAERIEQAEQRLEAAAAVAQGQARAGFDTDLERLREASAADHRETLEASAKTLAEQAEKVGADLAERAEQSRIELGSRIETRLRETREELDRSNAEAIAAAEQRTLIDGGAAVDQLVAEAIVGAETRLQARVQEARAELLLNVDDATTRLGNRIDAEIADRLAQARTALEEGARERARAEREDLKKALGEHADEQLSLRAKELREALKTETETMLSAETSRLRQEAEARAREGEQRAVLSATETSRNELVARVDTELERLTEANQIKLGDHEQRVGALVEQGQSEIDHARAQIEDVSRGLERKARRHELKLIKAESKKRIQTALQGVETQAALIEVNAARAAERLDASKIQLQETETRVSEALSRVDSQSGDLGLRAEQALARLEAAIGDIEGSRARVLSVEQRVGEAELHVRKVGEMSDQATAVELRIRRATEAEADATAKIFEAERRLTNLADR